MRVSIKPATWDRWDDIVTAFGRRASDRIRALRRVLTDDQTVWWVTSFGIRLEHRGPGVAAALGTPGDNTRG